MRLVYSQVGDGQQSRQRVVGVHALPEPGLNLRGYKLDGIVGRSQRLAAQVVGNPGLLARELSQALAQDLRGQSQGQPDFDDVRQRVQVFVSHTKQDSAAEKGIREHTVDAVRQVLRDSHLDEFFDAHDIQVSDDWAQVLDREAARSALLMVRTDLYSSREWTQREVLTAKMHDLPIVALFAATAGDERGSFLMDHVPMFPCRADHPTEGIERALGRLVDETLKRELWKRQLVYLKGDGFDWMPANAPELVTLVPWLVEHRRSSPGDPHVWVIHPDPPLGPQELSLLEAACHLAGFDHAVDVLTPRTFASRGGRVRR